MWWLCFALQAAREYLRTEQHLTIPLRVPVKYPTFQRKIRFEGNEGVARIVYQVSFLLELEPTPCRPFFLFDACDPNLGVLVYFDKVSALPLLTSDPSSARPLCYDSRFATYKYNVCCRF